MFNMMNHRRNEAEIVNVIINGFILYMTFRLVALNEQNVRNSGITARNISEINRKMKDKN